jgi:hypothetical protein
MEKRLFEKLGHRLAGDILKDFVCVCVWTWLSPDVRISSVLLWARWWIWQYVGLQSPASLLLLSYTAGVNWVFQKELYNDIPYVDIWRMLHERLCLKAYKLFFFQVAPQLHSRGWVHPVADPLLLREYGSAGNRARDLWICRQEIWSVDHRGTVSGLTYSWPRQ